MHPRIEQLKQQAGRLFSFLKHKYQEVSYYFKTHPKQRKWAIAASVILGPPLLFLLVVWIEIPSKRALRNIQNQVASEVYSADSVLLGRYYIQDRTEVTYEEIAPVVFDALIATEDIRFYEHQGIDYRSLGRVLVKSIFMQDESAGGGSTITQQLAKNLYPRKRYWLLSMPINKMREFITAARIEDIYSKEAILTMYLNTIPFADLTFGIEAAAKRFFSVSAKDLTINQAALLVGMLKANHTYNPRLFPDRAKQRRNVVLSQMVKFKGLPQQQFDSLQKIGLGLKYNKSSSTQGFAPYFREFLKGELEAWCNLHTKEDGEPYNIYTDGLKIYTTLNSKLQQYAEDAVARQMEDVQRTFFAHWGNEKPWKGKEEVIQDAIRRSLRYQKLKAGGASEQEIMKEMNTPVPMRIFTWDGDRDVMIKPIDSIKHHIQFLNAGFLAMEPHTGDVLAWVGGIDHSFFQYDHVKPTTKRQVGSIFKPIVYAMALEKGVDPCELISAERETYIDKEGVEWTPRNSQLDYEVDYSMRGALAYSVNTVAVKLIMKAGVENTVALARNMGITSEIPDVPSIALGSTSISLTEMTTAYACFANDGKPVQPNFIKSITDLEGKIYTNEKAASTTTRVISPDALAMTLRMMQSVVHEGTASRLRWRYNVYNDVAGKTGTTQANADGWFMAVTPNLVMGSWVGADDPRIRFRSTELGQGSSTALPIAGYFLQKVNEDDDFKSITSAKFPELPPELSLKLDCDLYELDSVLVNKIRVTMQQQDSLAAADTLYIRRETFLETLLKRKEKIRLRSAQRDSLEQASRAINLIN